VSSDARRYRIIVLALASAFTVVLATASVARHDHYSTQVFDLGIFDQGLWLVSRLRDPFVTLRGLNLFGDHSSYLMVSLAPLYWILPDVRALIVLTVMALAAGAVLAYEVCRTEGVRPSLSALVAGAYLLHPAVSWSAWDNFHPEVLAIPLLLAAHLLFLRHRPGWAFALIVLVLAAKEDAALVVVPYGAYIWWRNRDRRWGPAVVVTGLVVFVLNVMVLLPAFSPTGDLIYLNRYGQFGDTLAQALVSMATSPLQLLRELTTFPRVMYVGAMIVPLSLAVLAPEVLLIGVPISLANLLSIHGYQHDIRFHYTAYLIAVLVMAAAVGARRLQGWLRRGRWLNFAFASVLTASLVALVMAGPIPRGPTLPGIDDRHPEMRDPWGWSAQSPQLVEEAIALIPSDAAVAADYTVAPHLAHRDRVYMFPNPFVARFWSVPGAEPPPPDDVEWVVVRRSALGFEDVRQGFEIVMQQAFTKVLENDEVIVYRRS